MHVTRRLRIRSFAKLATSLSALSLILLSIVMTCSQPANALPAFARKYGLRCSACHESWPMLNYFGQKFKDNGYQLMNDRDAPIWQNPGYWPVTFRITPIWHRVSTDKVLVDTYAGGVVTGTGEVERITSPALTSAASTSTPAARWRRTFSFYVLPSSDPTGAFHFETVMARLDNIVRQPLAQREAGQVRTRQPAFRKAHSDADRQWRHLPALSLHSGGGWQHLRADGRQPARR